MRTLKLGNTGDQIPIIGQGTWGIKKYRSKTYYENWKKSLRKGIELGMTHIDTAEFYGRGKSEKVIGEIIGEYGRDELFITSKLFPMHFTLNSMKKAADNSLNRLKIDYFDLYLIHWPSPLISIKKQMEILELILKEEKTRYIGVSNYSVKQFEEAQSYLNDAKLITNQLPANITNQNHIHNSLDYYRQNDVIITAYSPLSHGGYSKLKGELRSKLEKLASDHDASIQQVAIAWLINHPGVITIPKAFKTEHLEANAKAADITFSSDEIQFLYSKA